MEIRDPIHGSLKFDEGEVAIIESSAFQRLREIKQLGFMEFSFPGATHTRFLHSLGVCHLSGLAFDQIFGNYLFPEHSSSLRLRQCVRLAALLHDIGHGPLSHTIEEVMPNLSELKINAYNLKNKDLNILDRKSNHEDYTIKFITDSSLTNIIKSHFTEILPIHIACLIDKTLKCPDDFFQVGDLDFRPILSQIVSSELDVDRMDYLERDAYFCGTTYGKVETNWLLSNMTFHQKDSQLNLALNRRALYTFDDFLLARHHMHLMVYFHHKAIVYEEILMNYLTSKDCEFILPSDIEDYINYTDYHLYQHLAHSQNRWAKQITERKPYKMLFEFHSTKENSRVHEIQEKLNEEGIPSIQANSTTRLSKYHSPSPAEKSFQIFVVDQYDKRAKPYPIEESTEIFQKYEEIRRIERVYVPHEKFSKAEKIMVANKL